jgi:ABC-type multidrug transport system fused ATPase/permease subunit
MRRRLAFWGRSLIRGSTAAHFFLAAASLAVGLTAFGVLSWWLGLTLLWAIPIAIALVFALLAEGSYRHWDAVEKELSEARGELNRRNQKALLLESLARKLMSGPMYKPIGLLELSQIAPEEYEAELEETRTKAKEWARSTRDFIRDRIGWDEAAIFDNDYGLPPQYEGPSIYLATEDEIGRFLARRCIRLEQIVVRLRGSDS